MPWALGTRPERKAASRGFMLSGDAWDQALKDHKKRMGYVKSTISFGSMPWGFDQQTGEMDHRRSAKPPNGARPGTGSSARRRHTGSNEENAAAEPPAAAADGSSARKPATPHPPGSTAGKEARGGVSSLPPAQQQQCRQMIALLVSMSHAQCKRVVEEMFVEAEESRLLQAYTGVLPGMSTEEGQETH